MFSLDHQEDTVGVADCRAMNLKYKQICVALMPVIARMNLERKRFLLSADTRVPKLTWSRSPWAVLKVSRGFIFTKYKSLRARNIMYFTRASHATN